MKSLDQYILESLEFELLDYLLKENRGVFDGCEILIDYVIKLLDENMSNKTQIIDTNHNSNIFDKLIINVEWNKYGNVQCSYKFTDKFNTKASKLEECVINCNLPIEIKNNFFTRAIQIVRRQLLHELTHCWQNYNILLKKITKGIIGNIKPVVKIDTQVLYDDIKDLLNEYFKFTHKFEKSAYISEFYAFLLDNEKELAEIKDLRLRTNKCLEIIRSSNLYKNIENMFRIREDIKHANSLKLKTYIILYKQQFPEVKESRIVDSIIDSINKMEDKINSSIGKEIIRFYEYLASKETYECFSFHTEQIY